MARNPYIPRKIKQPRFIDLPKSAGILDDHAVRKNLATKEGTIEKVPVNDNDLVNKKYVDDNAGLWEIDGAETQLKSTTNIDMQTRKIINLNTPKNDTDASTKLYVDDNIVTSADIDHNQTINTHNLTSDIDHDQLTNFVSNKHIDWTNATDDFDTRGFVRGTAGESRFSHLTYTDPQSGIARDLKLGDEGLALRGGMNAIGNSIFEDDLEVQGESKGSRVLITAGNAVNYTGLEKNMKVGSCLLQGDKGIPMPRAGSIVGMSVMADCSNFTSSGTFTYRCYKNGSVVFSGSYTISSTGVTTHEVTQARGIDTFVAGDIIKLSGQGHLGYRINNTIMTLEIQFDT